MIIYNTDVTTGARTACLPLVVLALDSVLAGSSSGAAQTEAAVVATVQNQAGTPSASTACSTIRRARP